MSSAAETPTIDISLHFGRDDIGKFKRLVWDYYAHHKRPMSWRSPALKASANGVLDPYLITISEVMLQQTQVSRAREKYPVFIFQFPNFVSLAQASTADVIKAWQGLGYNRRALNLHKLAQIVGQELGGELPSDPAELVKLPGIGPHTAGSIAAFAFNKPAVFIETNIRRVFIHHFFADQDQVLNLVGDKQLLPLIEAALDRQNPREWYWALMDYGSHLAKSVPNPNRRSKHYTIQTKFEGSDRQLRGQILRELGNGASDLAMIQDSRRDNLLAQLINEGFVERNGPTYSLGN